jgi:GT2 family glycosyltransferase
MDSLMRILITCVCYNNFTDAYEYINSLSSSLKYSKCSIELDVFVVNNGIEFTGAQTATLSNFGEIKVSVINNINNGYFGGCLAGYKAAISTGKSYDAMIASNVDLAVESDFLEEFMALISIYQEKSAIIAPSIFSLSENKDRNPKVKIRYSLKQMKKYVFLYTIPYLHALYKNTLYKNKVSNPLPPGSEIYAPHGSFIIFVGGVDNWEGFLNYPVFLFGEEIHIGEQAKALDLPVVYHPELKVLDSDHASTGLQNESFLRKHNLTAMRYLIKRYWS